MKLKEDLILIALYSLAYNNYHKVREYENELIKHLELKYTIKNNEMDSFVQDNLYGNDTTVSDFIIEVKDNLKKK